MFEYLRNPNVRRFTAIAALSGALAASACSSGAKNQVNKIIGRPGAVTEYADINPGSEFFHTANEKDACGKAGAKGATHVPIYGEVPDQQGNPVARFEPDNEQHGLVGFSSKCHVGDPRYLYVLASALTHEIQVSPSPDPSET